MAPLFLAIAPVLFLLVSLPHAFASPDFAAQRIPFGGSLFELEPRNFKVHADAGDVDNNCGGASGCTTTEWGCQCGFTDGSWMEDAPPSKPSPSPPAPPKPDGTLKCTPTKGSSEAKMFSQSKAKDQITKICQAYVDDGLVLNFDGHSFGKQLRYFDLGATHGSSEHDSVLVIGLDHAKANCADVNDAKPLDFKALGVGKCEEYFMRVVDGCPNFENPNGHQYWKWGGKNQHACAFWTVIAS